MSLDDNHDCGDDGDGRLDDEHWCDDDDDDMNGLYQYLYALLPPQKDQTKRLNCALGASHCQMIYPSSVCMSSFLFRLLL